METPTGCVEMSGGIQSCALATLTSVPKIKASTIVLKSKFFCCIFKVFSVCLKMKKHLFVAETFGQPCEKFFRKVEG